MRLAHLVIPYPPAVNTYWRARVLQKGKRLIPVFYVSTKGKTFRKRICQLIKPPYPIQGLVSLELKVWFPDRRKRDTDGIQKAMFDSLTHAGVWPDDWVIREFSVRDMGIYKDGIVEIVVRRYNYRHAVPKTKIFGIWKYPHPEEAVEEMREVSDSSVDKSKGTAKGSRSGLSSRRGFHRRSTGNRRRRHRVTVHWSVWKTA